MDNPDSHTIECIINGWLEAKEANSKKKINQLPTVSVLHFILYIYSGQIRVGQVQRERLDARRCLL